MVDVIHKPTPHTIYEQTQYLVNSDMTIPMMLAETWMHGIETEVGRHKGFPQTFRGNVYSPLVLAPGSIPQPKARKPIG